MDYAPMPVSTFDQIDRRILSELQDDGRMTNVDLAARFRAIMPR
jgi:DNA-binding Lrp family transcriptional regulator